jgi:8-oxo-dGTP diphosphatase
MKQFKHLGAYGLIIEEGKIVLIKKKGGPYNEKLDLPGGTIEWGETPEHTLIRELNEEVGIDVTNYELFDTNSVVLEWMHKEELEKVHHLGIFYKILDYNNDVLEKIKIDEKNDDSLGARFYEIDKLRKNELSDIAKLEIEKFGYKLKN